MPIFLIGLCKNVHLAERAMQESGMYIFLAGLCTNPYLLERVVQKEDDWPLGHLLLMEQY